MAGYHHHTQCILPIENYSQGLGGKEGGNSYAQKRARAQPKSPLADCGLTKLTVL